MIRDQFLKKISKRDKKQVARCKETTQENLYQLDSVISKTRGNF